MQELSFKTKRKILYLEIFVFSISLFVFLRLLYLQFIKSAELYKKAIANQTQIIKIQANRSIIYDRTRKNTLAYNKKSIAVYLVPAHLPEKILEQRIVFSNLMRLINVSYEEIQTAITQQAIDRYTPVILKYDIDSSTLVKLSEFTENLKGVYWENMPTRVYPLGERAAHLIGYTGIISKSELKKLKSNPEYHPGSIIGKMGIEGYYDEIIRGTEGIKERIVDATGKVKEEEIKKEPIPGNSLVLSIDSKLQEFAHSLIASRVGAIIVSKPATGEILALVSSPSFDPNIFTSKYIEEESFFLLMSHAEKPFLNRAIQGTYPPSSIFKIVTSTALLHSEINPDKIIYCPGYMKIGNRIFKCWSVHGGQNLVSGIANSCDVYFYSAGLSLGRDIILHYAQEWGINRETGIDLVGELKGSIPDMEWFKKKYNRPWQNGDTANIAIGQGDLLITPIGLNVMTMAIANDGLILKPFLLKEMLSYENESRIWQKNPEVLRRIDISKEKMELIKKGMYGVTTYGTAKWIKNAIRIPIAGKTGTGEAGKGKETHALFTAYAPYNATNINDVIAVTVVVEHGGGGSGVAAPVAVKIIDFYFNQKERN
ncbi:MAG: penicillin-binding protein 2 [Brevinematia bacterium]